MVHGRVAHDGVPHDPRGLRDQFDVEQVVVIVEVQQGDEARVEDPEVLGGQTGPVRILAPQVADVLADGRVVPGVVEQNSCSVVGGLSAMRTRPTCLLASVWRRMLMNQGSLGSQVEDPVARNA